MQFREQPWESRFERLGDEAEGRFEEYATNVLKLGFIRYGLNRPPLKLAQIPARVRYTPDYLMSRCFVEVQGLGKDQRFKLKLDKHGALHWWNDLRVGDFDGVKIYIWDSHKQRECFLHLSLVDEVIAHHGKLDRFPEGKAFFELPADELFNAAP